MAATVTGFRALLPEFDRIGDTQIQAHLDVAALQCDANVWGDFLDAGIYYLAGHQMAYSPAGNAATFKGPDGNLTTTHEVHYKRIQSIVSSGYRVI